jgi:hypothetical protein
MSVDNYDFVLEGGTCSLKYSLEPVAFYWRFLALETVAATKIEGNRLPPLSGHVSSDGCARRGSHKVTASPSSVPRRAAPPRPGGCRAVPSPSSPTRPPSGAGTRARPRAAKKGDRRYPLQSDHISRIQPTSKSMNIIAKRENRPRRIVKFHKTRHIQLRHGRSTIPKGEGEAYYHWCFSDLETARSSSNNLMEQSYKHNRSKRDNARAGWRRNTA